MEGVQHPIKQEPGPPETHQRSHSVGAKIPVRPRASSCTSDGSDTGPGKWRQTVASGSLLALGIPAGVICSSYLATGGFFADRLHSEVIFGLMNFVVSGAYIFIVIVQEATDEILDRYFGVQGTYAFRLIVLGFLTALITLAMPFCHSKASVMILGSFMVALAALHQSSAQQLSAAIVKGGGLLVSFGVTLGGALPLLLSIISGFHPGCPRKNMWWFFILTAAISMGCTVAWAVEHVTALRQSPVEDSSNEEAGQLIAKAATSRASVPQLVRAYRSLSMPSMKLDKVGAPGSSWCRALSRYFSPYGLALFALMCSGIMIQPLFTMVNPLAAQRMYLMRCLGDFLGRAAAIVQSNRCSARGYVGQAVRLWCVVLLILRLALAGVTMWAIIGHRLTYAGPWICTALVLCFMFGGYSMLVLDLDAQLQQESKSGRRNTQRTNLVIIYAGQIIGTTIGTAIVWTLG